jgi:hypothetical protein
MPVVITPSLDTFDRAPEPEIEGDETNPASGIRPPWFMTPWALGNPELESDPDGMGGWINGAMAGTLFPNAHVSAYLYKPLIYGPRVQSWGVQTGSAALADTWRWGIWTAAGVHGGYAEGWQCLPWDAIGDNVFLLRGYQGGAEVVSTSVVETLGGTGSRCVMDYDESTGVCDIWHSIPGTEAGYGGAPILSASMALAGPYYVSFGMTGVETGWGEVGGGRVQHTQIYRYVSN